MKALSAGMLLCSVLGCTTTIDGKGNPAAAQPGSGAAGAGAGSSTGGTGGDTQPGTGGTSGVGAAGTGTTTCGDGLTARRLRRLSVREYANVVADLLGQNSATEVLATLPPEPSIDGFDNQDSALRVFDSLQETISDLAASLASKVSVATLSPCAEPNGSASCLDTFMRSFAAKAYGRPLTDDEATRMAAVAATGQDYATSVRLVVELVLQSPHFIYVSELGAPDAPAASGQPIALTPYEVASQLSFLLSGRRPDAALMEKAAAAGLATSEAIRAEADRLLQAPAAAEQLARFVVGWLDMGPIAEASKSEEAFPELTPAVVAAMQEEFDAFVTTQLNGGNGTLAAMMTAQSTQVPPALLPIYGSDYASGTGLDPRHRGGVLSLPGLLSFHATPQHSGPVERGLFIRRQLLCMAVQSPPPDVLDRIAANPIPTEDGTTTTRQKFEVHENDPACSGCHTQFDPIGYGLEQMDGIGRFRTTENQLPVDSHGELFDTDVDGPFEGVVELSQKLLQSQMFERCMVGHYFRFTEARPAADADQCVVDDWSAAFTQGGGKLRDLVIASVGHPAFATRKDDR